MGKHPPSRHIYEYLFAKIFDSVCGSGGMFVQSAWFVSRHQVLRFVWFRDVSDALTLSGSRRVRIPSALSVRHSPCPEAA